MEEIGGIGWASPALYPHIFPTITATPRDPPNGSRNPEQKPGIDELAFSVYKALGKPEGTWESGSIDNSAETDIAQ
jgi:hypothetical protein